MTSKTRRLLSLVLVLATVFALFTGVTAFAATDDAATTTDTSNVGSFTDVNWSSPYAEAVAVLAAAKITTGTTDTTFGPKENVTREQISAFIARTGLGAAKAEMLLSAETGFSDVPKDDFYSKYIAWGVSQNAINGMGDGTYNPKGNVTGVQVMKILLGVLNADKVTELTGPLWETNTISQAIKLGLIEGVQVDDYSAAATREQIAQYLMNAMVAYGYYDSGYGTSSIGWQQGAEPLYVTNGLSRRQTEDTSRTDDGTFEPEKFLTKVTPYGELYYRWETSTNGRGVTAWKHDDKNEKLMSTVIANPTTTGTLPNLNPDVFKVYINGALVSATGAGTNNAIGNISTNRFITNEYTFNPSLAGTALRIVSGNPNVYGQVTDETWTGATVKIYEQRLSGNGVYDPVTGRYGTGGYEWPTFSFDGKSDKVIVTYDYLAEVAFKSTTSSSTTYEFDLFDATFSAPSLVTNGRSGNVVLFTAKGVRGDYAVDEIVRVVPVLPATSSLGGAYMGWFGINSTTGLYQDNGTLGGGTIMDSKFNYLAGGTSISLLEHSKADTKQITPTNYGYAWASSGSTQTSQTNARQGLYISATSGSEVTWISGTYQEILRTEKNDLYADGSRYTVYLDKNGYILGGFTQAGAEYAFLTSALTNENSLTSTWRWLTTNDSDPRSMTYYPGRDVAAVNTTLTNAFKELVTTATDKNIYTTSERDMNNGLLKATTSVSGNASYVYVGDVVRVWNSHAKILQGYIYNGSSLPSNGKLYIEVTYDLWARSFVFTKRSASDANTNFKRNTNATVYQYIDGENYIQNDNNTVYVIDYTAAPNKFTAPRASGTAPTAPSTTNLVAAIVNNPQITTATAPIYSIKINSLFSSALEDVVISYTNSATPAVTTQLASFSIGTSAISNIPTTNTDTVEVQAQRIVNYLNTTLVANGGLMGGAYTASRNGSTVNITIAATGPVANGPHTLEVTSNTIAATNLTLAFTDGIALTAAATDVYTLNLPTLKANNAANAAQNTVTIVATPKAAGGTTTTTVFTVGISAANLAMDSQVAQLNAIVNVIRTGATAGNYAYTHVSGTSIATAPGGIAFDELQGATWSLANRTLTITAPTFTYTITVA